MCSGSPCLISKIVIMRVLYILNSTLQTGGATKAIMGIVPLLQEKGVKPIFLMPDQEGIYRTLIEQGYDTISIPFKMSIYPDRKNKKDLITFLPKLACRIIINILALYKIRKLVKILKPDIIHTNTSVVSLGRIVARWTHIPHIQHIREYGDKNFSITYFPSWRIVHYFIKKNNSYTICITQDIKNHHGLKDLEHAVVIYDGTHPFTPSMPHGSSLRYFLYAGRIEYGKGLDLLLESYACYTREVEDPIPLKVAGSVANLEYDKRIKHYIAEKHITKLVSFLGNVSQIEALMQNAKALIIPSRSEGFGLCMPEAMFNGCLCIGFGVGGTKEQMDNGMKHTGGEIALSYQTTEELTKLLVKVHQSSDDHWAAIKKRAFNTVNALYTHEKCAEAVLNIYHKIVQE